jgi:hypothetical protein
MIKTRKKISRNLLGGIGAVGLLCLLLTSCLKTDNSSFPPPATALITFVHAIPDETPVNFFLNGDQVNQSPVSYGFGVDYVSAFAGVRTVNVYHSSDRSSVLSAPVTLSANTAYSFFLATTSTHKPQALLLTDTLNKPASGKAGLRFVNVSPDAPAVDLVIKGGPVVAANKSPLGYSAFLPVQGKTNYTFEVRAAGTGTVLATLPNVTLNEGALYTIWLGGFVASTGSSNVLTEHLIANAFF